MGLRGPKSAASKAAKPLKACKNKTLPWNKRGLSRSGRVSAFLEFLPISSGTDAGKKMVLRPWQKEIIEGIYAVDSKGRRPVRTAVLSLPRKNGKTQLAAGLALCHLLGSESEERGQVFSAGSDRQQASLIFNEMEACILRVPEFAERCHVQSFHKQITDTTTGSVYRALTADSRKTMGLNVSFAVGDEIAMWSSRDLWDGLTTGTGARKEPLVIGISTQSADPRHLMSELVDFSQKITEGTLPADPSFYGKIYAAPDDCNPWDEQVWHACNPALGDFRSLEEMRSFAEQAQKIPARESVFRNLYLNMRVDAEARWISSAAYDDCVGALPDLQGRVCYAGLDLSSTQDLSALSLCFVPIKENEPFYTLHFAWCPKDSIKTRSKNDRVPYGLWAKDGFIEPTPGAVIDYSYILKRIDAIAKKYDLKAILFDRWGATQIVKNLEDMGLTVLEFGQGFASMSPPSKELEKLVLSRGIVFPDNPVLSWCFSNVIAEIDAAGNIKPSKKKSKEKIDLCVSTVMALDGALRNSKKEVIPTISWI